MQPEKLDDVKSLAAYFGNSVAFWRKKSRQADFPKIKCGRSVRFDRNQVLEHLRKQGTKEQ
jgi:hypothetical protein